MRPFPALLAALGLTAAGLFLLARRQRSDEWRARMPIPGFDFAGWSKARYQGGDYHEIILRPDKRSMAVAVGDVAGHDALAARLRQVASRLLRARHAAPGDLAALVGEVNRKLAPHMHAGRFMTLFLAVMVGEGRSIHWVSAGHAPVLSYDPVTDRFGEVPGPDIPLGIDPEWRYHELTHIGWAPGALLLVATDGIWEARNPAGQMYGKGRVMRVVRAARFLSAASIVAAVTADVASFRQGRPAEDDATLVVVKAL